jgi:uncharacterized protein (DUF1015 family)
MADVRPFRALRYDPARVDLADTIAPPYDVISSREQQALYARSPHNIVRIEYGEQHPDDTPASNRYTRACADLESWIQDGVLIRDAAPAVYKYRLTFDWDGIPYERAHYFITVRLEEWEKGAVKPHEHTLSGPKADRLELLRATRAQVSPVYCLYRERTPSASTSPAGGERLYDVEVDGQRHILKAITDADEITSLRERLAASDFYIADGHHRYETALAYRNERRTASSSWTGEEPENFVLMAVTDASDPGLLVLPTHRVVHRPMCAETFERLAEAFDIDAIDASEISQAAAAGGAEETRLVAIGLEPGATHLLRLRDRASVEARMPATESSAWKRLDVNVLQYAILEPLFGIDDAALAAGGAVTYTQDSAEARDSVDAGKATSAFLLNATPVDQVIAVSDANGRMPQKSTYFYPKLPTGLVLNALD